MAIEPSICRAPDTRPARWWVAQVQSQDEERVVNAAESWLRKHDLEGSVLAPCETVRKTYQRKDESLYTKEWDRPIFPGYVFYSGERDAIFEARQIIRVLDTDEDGSDQIGNFVKAYAGGPVRRANEFPLSEGLHVKVVAGPFRYCEGVIEKFGDTKVFLKVHSIGWSELETDRSNIEPFWGD